MYTFIVTASVALVLAIILISAEVVARREEKKIEAHRAFNKDVREALIIANS